MSNITEYLFEDIDEKESIAFLVCASFEERCLSIARQLHQKK